jgi:glycosyltransferase involved in cell wall biosynthesis
MKYTVFIPSLQAGSGAERAAVVLAEGLADSTSEVDLLVLDSVVDHPFSIDDDVNLISLDASRTATSLPFLIRYLRSYNPDVLFSHMDHANIISILSSLISQADTNVISTVQNYTSSNAKTRSRIIYNTTIILAKMLYPYSNKVVAVSRSVKKDLIDNIGIADQKVEVIHNPVFTKGITEKAKKDVDHAWFSKESNVPVITAIGRLNTQKDFPTLIKAFKILRDSRECRLLILGEGEERDSLEELIKENGLCSDISLPGYVENPYAYLSQSSLFVLSSRWEGLPTVIIEALAVGTPVVSTDCPGGASEILGDGAYGELVPVGDAHSLASAFESALKDSHNRERLVSRAKDFSSEKSVTMYKNLIN